MRVPTIETARLRLRATTLRDLEAVLETVTDPEVMRHLGGVRDEAAVRDSFEQLGADAGAYVFTVADVVSDVRLGGVTVDRRAAERPGHVVPGGGELELSYVFRASAWGHGYAQEACRAALAHVAAEEDVDQPVLVVTQVANGASRRLAERLGFRAVARFEEFGVEQLLAQAPLSEFMTMRPPAVHR